MKLEVRGCRLPITGTLREFVARRFRFALSRYQGQLAEVRVHLSDENGPRGGRDKACRVVATVLSRSLFVGEVDPDLHTAISRAAERTGRAVSRELERHRVLRRQDSETSSMHGQRKCPQSTQEEQ